MDKSQIYNKLTQLIKQKIEVVNQSLQVAEESRNLETKSSAGDKYETGRAMAQNEMDRLRQQLETLINQSNLLNLINPEVKQSVIGLGSMVKTNHGVYYISIGHGQISTDKGSVFCISPVSPIGKEMIDKGVGDVFEFNGREYVVESVI